MKITFTAKYTINCQREIQICNHAKLMVLTSDQKHVVPITDKNRNMCAYMCVLMRKEITLFSCLFEWLEDTDKL